ncbi:MAG: glycosyltransferase [Anaerolineae bacterium]|nr:glycosyltransferase [Anaerolineae bacterium]
MSDRALSISVIIPCYNEEKNLQRGVLDEVYQHMRTQPYPWDVIVADDGSTDNSRALVEAYIAGVEGFTLAALPHGGKPSALWGGIQHATGDAVLFTDMDQSTPIGELDKLLPWYAQGYDVVIGSRGAAREGFSLLRRVGSVVFRAMRSVTLLRGIRDTQCGFKLFRRAPVLEIFPKLQFFAQQKPSGWKVTAYDVELLYLFDRAGYTIKEVEVAWMNRDESDTKGQGGEFTRYMRESLDMAKEVLRVNVNRIKGLYD